MSTLVSSMTNSQTKAPLLHDPIAKIISTRTFMHRTCQNHEARHCYPFQIFDFKSRKTQNITNFALFQDFTKSYTFIAENKNWIQPCRESNQPKKHHDFTKWYTFYLLLPRTLLFLNPLSSSLYASFFLHFLHTTPPHKDS